ncbi:hypothetical protein MBANPS3_012466 [Mucor bainieri]
MWARVKKDYDSVMSEHPGFINRMGFHSRWATINRLVSKFHEHLEQVKRMNISGANVTDLMIMARMMKRVEAVFDQRIYNNNEGASIVLDSDDDEDNMETFSDDEDDDLFNPNADPLEQDYPNTLNPH